MKQKLLASAMALAMVLSLTPVTALAAEGEDTTLPEEEITVQTESESPVQEETPVEESVTSEEASVEEIPEEFPVETEQAEESTELEEFSEDTVSQLGDLNIASANNTVTKGTVAGSYIFTAPGDSAVTDYSITATLGSGAELTATTPNDNELYVASVDSTTAQLKFRVKVNDEYLSDNDMFTLTLTSADGGTTWTGGFTNAALLTLDSLADSISNFDISLAAGALGAGSASRDLLVNMDDVNVMMVLCAPDTTVYTVTYMVENSAIEWELPAGMNMPTPQLDLDAGESVTWYTDANHQNVLDANAIVEANTTIYADITSSSVDPDPDPDPEPDFLTALKNGDDVTIDSTEDWNLFVQNSASTQAGQVVTLDTNINCQGASYESLKFYGDFNGGNNTISNATFEATSDTPSGESCCGMFATLRYGQTIANLKLVNIEVEYAGEYAGTLVGMADGYSNDRVHIQNVQVSGGSVSGRSAGGIAGFTRNTDIIYCSSQGTSITGIANGGGIVGINNAKVELCFSTTSPTALPSVFGGSTGGVVAKNVRGGRAVNSWCYEEDVEGATDQGGENTGSRQVPEGTIFLIFKSMGFTQPCWVESTTLPADFDSLTVTLNFNTNS